MLKPETVGLRIKIKRDPYSKIGNSTCVFNTIWFIESFLGYFAQFESYYLPDSISFTYPYSIPMI